MRAAPSSTSRVLKESWYSKILFNFLFAVLHPQPDFNLVGQRKVLEVKGLAGADADPGEFLANDALFRSTRRELESEVEVVEEILLHQLRIGLGKVDGRGGGRRGLLEIGRQGLHLMPACTFSTFGMSAELRSCVR